MNHNIKKATTFFIFSLLLILALVSSGCFESEGDKKRITAERGFEKAKEISNNQNEEAVLESITCLGSPQEGGKSSRWSFDYIAPLENGTYETFDIIIDGNLKAEVGIGGYVNQSKRTLKPLLNWTIDSDEAMDIAKENQKISGYLDEYDGAEVDHMQLDMWEEYSRDDGVWVINWLYNAGMDNPKNARAIINANTGEVIEAEADN